MHGGALFALAWLLASATATSPVRAQSDALEAPSTYQRQIDAGVDTTTPEFEADAAEAQGSEIRAGDDPTGLDHSGRRAVEEIVVRARKRAEYLEDTPLSVTALSPTLLREAGVTNINDIENLVPNVTFRSGGLGQQIRIRGVGASSGGAAFDPGVGLYLDGVFLPRSRNAVLDLVDVQQIEVLRGPQGTLFGKNTVGGAVNVTTVKPQMEPDAFVFLRPGNLGSIDTRAMINLPMGSGWLDGKLATRLAFGSRLNRGFAFNSVRDTYLSSTNSQSFVGAIRFLPTEKLTIDVSGSYSKRLARGPGGQCVFMESQELTSLAPGLEAACRETRPFEVQSDLLQLRNIADYGAWGIVTYEVGDVSILDDVSLRSVTSWRQQRTRSRTDLDATRLDVVNLNAAGGGPGLRDGTPGRAEQIQQEAQLNASAWDGRIHFVTGLFTFWETSEAGNTVLTRLDTGVGTVVNGTNSNIKTDNFTWALYGQGTADVTEWLSLTAGIRYTSDGKSVDQLNRSATNPDAPPGGGTGEETFGSWTPMASVALLTPDDWIIETPLDHVMTYFTYARGFKGGGLNASVQVAEDITPTPFQPETLDNFELGVKTIAFDRRLTANVALFHGIYDNIQVTQQRTFANEAGEPQVQRVTLNAAEATNQGVELEVQGRPLRGAMIMGSVGCLDTRFGKFEDALSDLDGSVIDRTGQSFNSAPRWQTYLAAQFSFPVSPGGGSAPWLDGWVTPRVDWAYRSRYHVLGPEAAASIQRGYSLVGARLSYVFLDDRAQIALWGQNLLDEAYFNTAFSLGGTFGTMQRWYRPPRTFGAELSYRFG